MESDFIFMLSAFIVRRIAGTNRPSWWWSCWSSSCRRPASHCPSCHTLPGRETAGQVRASSSLLLERDRGGTDVVTDVQHCHDANGGRKYRPARVLSSRLDFSRECCHGPPPGWSRESKLCISQELNNASTAESSPEPRTLGDLRNSRWAEPPLRGRDGPRRDPHQPDGPPRDGRHRSSPASSATRTPSCPRSSTRCSRGTTSSCSACAARPRAGSCARSPALLDERIPIVAGSEVNDDPFAPISKYARELLAECGDATPIAWLRARAALRREARHARRHHRRPHRRRRSDQGGARRAPALRRAHHALRAAARAPIAASSPSTSCPT